MLSIKRKNTKTNDIWRKKLHQISTST
jgi:hypothetical protein